MAHVLLADDEAVLRMVMSRQLTRAGHTVVLAEDGQDAVERLRRGDFDVVVSDMVMPRLDGMGLLAAAAELAPDTEFVILTGHGSMENAVDAFKTGNVYDYLLKPLDDLHELAAVVERAGERRRLRRENARLLAELQQRVAELEAARERLAFLAERDGLTGLYNHRAIHSRLEEALTELAREPLSVVLADVDNFKKLNDRHGHPVGDQMLRHIAAALEEVCEGPAILGRCGGDEFMAVLPGRRALQAGDVADRVRKRLSEAPFRSAEGTALPLRLSYGVTDTEAVGRSAIALVATADAALYDGKQRGGDRITLHVAGAQSNPDDLRSAFGILDALVTAVDRKDRYTKRHSEHAASCALLLAERLEASEDTKRALRLAGLLHDVGKIGLPEAILRKPGSLSCEEYEAMKGHVTISTLIIHGVPRLVDVLEAVAHHHERWDGAGYPTGLHGDQIPLLGRILAIADAFSAMTMDRAHRSGVTPEEALAEIERCAGTQFDPELVPLFCTAVRERTASPLLAA